MSPDNMISVKLCMGVANNIVPSHSINQGFFLHHLTMLDEEALLVRSHLDN